MKLKDNSTQEIDTALYQLEQSLKSNIRLTDVENSNASSAKINAVDKKLTEEVKDRQSADGKLQDNINKEIADRQEADAAIENAKQDKLIAGNNIQIDGNVISATPKEYTAEAPVKVTDGKISLDTVPVNKGGTGVTTQAEINKAFIGNLEVGNSDVTDGTEFVSSYALDTGFSSTDEGSLNKPYKRQFIKVWNYIKGKISSVLGLTKDNYGGKASTAGIADKVDNYHASQLWRSDGAAWNPNANVSLNATADGDEWSFDILRNGHTGCYWHVWDSDKSTLLKVNADDGKVSAPYGFVGNLSGKAATAGTADKVSSEGVTGSKLTLQGSTVSSNSYTDTNPKLVFNNIDGSQSISLTFTDFDAVQAPASLTLNGNQGNEYFIAPNIKVNRNITLDGSNGVGPGTYGSEPLTIGFPNGTSSGISLGFDRNSIQARRNGEASILYLNYYGGMIAVNEQNQSNGGLKVKQKMVIPIGAPSQLEDGCIWIER